MRSSDRSYLENNYMAHVAEIDLSLIGDIKSSEGCDRFVNVIWVAWGDSHVREAMASAAIMAAINKPRWPNMTFKVFVPGDDVKIPESAIARIGHLVTLERIDDDIPSNAAMFDVMRVNILCRSSVASLYMDSDLYSFGVLRDDMLSGNLVLYGMGAALMGPTPPIHEVVDDVIGYPSYIYYADAGLSRSDYEAEFWPWLRINLGMFYSDDPSKLREFARSFSDLNREMEWTKYFGVGEMILTAMYNGGLVDGMAFRCLGNGYNKIWPWIANHDQQIMLEWTNGKISKIIPTGKHDVIHMGHLGAHLHSKVDPRRRKIHVWLEDDGQIAMHIGATTSSFSNPSSFDQV